MDIMKDIVSKHKIIAILRNVPEKELQAYTESLYEGIKQDRKSVV